MGIIGDTSVEEEEHRNRFLRFGSFTGGAPWLSILKSDPLARLINRGNKASSCKGRDFTLSPTMSPTK
jgi:hypothetical protein